jgi:hypothetical protein
MATKLHYQRPLHYDEAKDSTRLEELEGPPPSSVVWAPSSEHVATKLQMALVATGQGSANHPNAEEGTESPSQRSNRSIGVLSYPVFMIKPSTHHMHDPE